MTDAIMRLRGVDKNYGTEVVTRVLRGVDLTLARGEFAALMGPSGSGKSTLLNIVGLLDQPSAGEVWVGDERADLLDDDGRTRLRARSLGFVFQFHHLIGALSAVENIMMALAVAEPRLTREMYDRSLAILDDVGLADRADESPRRLSGGQQQRVAIARALVGGPPLILADEPTGNLDTETSNEIFELMRRFNRERGVAFLIVTHDSRIAERCDRTIDLVDGMIVSDTVTPRLPQGDPEGEKTDSGAPLSHG